MVVLGLGLIATSAALPARGLLEAIGLALLAWGLGLTVAGAFILLGRNPITRKQGGGR